MERHCLTCKHWQQNSEDVGICHKYNIYRFQFEGPQFEKVQGRVLQYDCLAYDFGADRQPYRDRKISESEADRIRREHDAAYEKMRYDKMKELPYWMRVKQERKQRLDQMVGERVNG